jgi:L-aminopeptidase/D-esterase-like protein
MTRPATLTDVAPLQVGHHTDPRRPTGCTVVLCGPHGAVAGIDVRGAAPGTRETDLLSPLNTVERVHAVLLAGGSAFGLDAAGGVMRWLDEHGIGVPVGWARVPIVPAAILFDLWLGDASIRPDSAAGHAACHAATDGPVVRGSVGAGAGAAFGKLFGFERATKGGIGSASHGVDGITVGALVALNAIGDVLDPASGGVLAGARGDDGRPLGISAQLLAGRTPSRPVRRDDPDPMQGTATTLAIVATDAVLGKAEANKLAQIAHDGLARRIDPVHTPFDGDTVFALATGHAGRSLPLATLGVMAAQAVADAVLDAVREATTLPGYESCPAWRDRRGTAGTSGTSGTI